MPILDSRSVQSIPHSNSSLPANLPLTLFLSASLSNIFYPQHSLYYTSRSLFLSLSYSEVLSLSLSLSLFLNSILFASQLSAHSLYSVRSFAGISAINIFSSPIDCRSMAHSQHIETNRCNTLIFMNVLTILTVKWDLLIILLHLFNMIQITPIDCSYLKVDLNILFYNRRSIKLSVYSTNPPVASISLAPQNYPCTFFQVQRGSWEIIGLVSDLASPSRW